MALLTVPINLQDLDWKRCRVFGELLPRQGALSGVERPPRSL